jgi:hypothetical protein
VRRRLRFAPSLETASRNRRIRDIKQVWFAEFAVLHRRSWTAQHGCGRGTRPMRGVIDQI